MKPSAVRKSTLSLAHHLRTELRKCTFCPKGKRDLRKLRASPFPKRAQNSAQPAQKHGSGGRAGDICSSARRSSKRQATMAGTSDGRKRRRIYARERGQSR